MHNGRQQNRVPGSALMLLLLALAGMTFGSGAPARAATPSPLDGFSADLDNSVNAVVQQPDGKILIGGLFTTINTTSRNRIARLNADGSLDTTFDPGLGADGTVNALALQADGKVLLGGEFSHVQNTPCNYIARLNANGSLDTTFNIGTGANYYVKSMVRQPDDKVLLGGWFVTINGTDRKGVARLNADGSLDTTFTPNITGEFVNAVALAPDGKVLLGGGTTTPIARLNANGLLDTSFKTSKGDRSWIYALAVQTDGRVLLGGDFTSIGGTACSHIARLKTDGSRDTSYTATIELNGHVNALALQADGKLLVGGAYAHINGTALNNIARLNADGALDPTFDPGGGTNRSVSAVALQADGKVLLGGQFTALSGTTRLRIARLNVNGLPEINLNIGTGAAGPVYALAQQPNGMMLLAGDFTTFSGTARVRIARLMTDGWLDPAFDPGIGASATIYAMALQPDGKVLLGGDFTTIKNTARGHIARLNADGSLDPTFDPGTGANNTVRALALQPDGKVLLGGDFTNFNTVTRSRIARLNADGSLDTTFNPGLGADGIVNTLALQPDGKVLLGGGFSNINMAPRGCFARLYANGSLDTTFASAGNANSSVLTLALQPDGKVLLGGGFTSINSTTRSRIARLNANGTLDTTFNPGTGANATVNALALQADGKVLLGGAFSSVNDTACLKVARLSAMGSLDATYIPGTGPNDEVLALALLSDGKLLLGGRFTSVGVTGCNRIARLSNPDGAWQDLAVSAGGLGATWSLGGSAPQPGQVQFEQSVNGTTWTLLGNGVVVPGVGYRLNGLTLPTKTNTYLRATGWVPGSAGSNGLYQSVRLFNVMPLRYTLTYIAGTHGTIDGKTSATQTVDRGTSGTTVSAVAETAYHFVQWSDGRTDNPRTDSGVTTDTRVTAAFAINQYQMVYIAGPHGSINGATSVTKTINYGDNSLGITAIPDTGYHFVKWSDGMLYASREDVYIMESNRLTASFAINQYHLTYLAGAHGSINGATSATQTANHGGSGTAVSAVAATGYHFALWSDGRTDNPRTDSGVTAPRSVTASFAINQYHLTYIAGAHGLINGATSATQTVNHGGSGTAVSAVAATGYQFAQWSDGRTDNPRTDSGVTAPRSVTASFAINQYHLTYIAGAHGSINGATSVTQVVNHGGSGTSVSAVAATGYHFVQWSDARTDNPRTDSGVTAPRSVTATFAITYYEVAFRTDGRFGASLTGTTTQMVKYSANCVAVTARAPAGSFFVKWTQGGATYSTRNPLTVTNVMADMTLTAVFGPYDAVKAWSDYE